MPYTQWLLFLKSMISFMCKNDSAKAKRKSEIESIRSTLMNMINICRRRRCCQKSTHKQNVRSRSLVRCISCFIRAIRFTSARRNAHISTCITERRSRPYNDFIFICTTFMGFRIIAMHGLNIWNILLGIRHRGSINLVRCYGKWKRTI